MAWTGDTISVIQEFLKERVLDDIVPQMKLRFPMYARIRKVTRKEAFTGKYARITMHTARPMNAQPRAETGDVALPGVDTFAEQHLNIMEYTSSIGITQNEMELAVKAGGSAVGNLFDIKMAGALDDMKYKAHLSFLGDGTGVLARVSGWTDGTQTVTVDNTAANMGWADVDRIKNGMYVDIYKIDHTAVQTAGLLPSAFTLCVSNQLVSSRSKSGKSFVVAAHTVDPAAAGAQFVYYVFIANSVNISGTYVAFRDVMGLHTIVDDLHSEAALFPRGNANTYNGSNYGLTFQNVDRSAYPQLASAVHTADNWGGGTKGTVTTADTKVIQDRIREIDEEGDGGGHITALYCNGATRDWLARKAYEERNAMVESPEGAIVPGMTITQFRSSTGRLIPVIPMVGEPDGHITGLDERDLVLFEPEPIGWYRGINGQILFPQPGSRNLTFEAWLRWKCQLGALRCDNMFRIEDIDLNT